MTSVIRLPLRPLTVACVAACVVVEVALVGWWAATGATIVFIGLQAAVLVLAWLGLLTTRYRGFRRDYEQALAANAILADRGRLADELHDALGHELSVIALKAGSLQVRTTGAVQQQAADIRRDVQTAVEKLHRALESVRETATEPMVAMIDRLIASGASITQTGQPPARLSIAAEGALNQVLRETLTNAIKHAPGQPITVTYRASLEAVVVEVRNPLPAGHERQSRPVTAGTGLAALRRRITSEGGRVDATTDRGVFLVTAQIPLHPRRPPSPAALRPLRSPLWQTIRWAVIPAATAVVVLVGFYTWSVHDDTIEDHTFARLRIGMSATAAEELLPDRQAPIRLVPLPLHDPAWSCRYYTDGNFPLGLAVFEVCFQDGSIVRLTDLRSQSWW